MSADKNPGKRVEAFGAYYFRVDLHVVDKKLGVPESIPFKSCSGLKSESAVVELEEGGFNTTTRKLIGRTKFPNIVLKQGLCGATSALWKLRQTFLNDGEAQGIAKKGRMTPNRISGTITQLGPNGAEAKWAFTSGWVCKWEGPDFDASKNEISIETIEIAHEGLMMLPGKEGKK